MDTPVKFDDDRAVIVIPDLAVGELEIFLQNMYQHKVVFVVSKDVVELMRPSQVLRIHLTSTATGTRTLI